MCNFKVMRWWCCSQCRTWRTFYIGTPTGGTLLKVETNWIAFIFVLFRAFHFLCILFCFLFHLLTQSFSLTITVSVSTCLCATRANKKQPTIAYSTFIDNFKFIYCCRSSLSNEYCTNNKYLYGQRKTTELHPDTHFYFSIWKSNRHRMENIDGKKAHAQIHKNSNTRAHTHIT